jgi:hypothetical protein
MPLRDWPDLRQKIALIPLDFSSRSSVHICRPYQSPSGLAPRSRVDGLDFGVAGCDLETTGHLLKAFQCRFQALHDLSCDLVGRWQGKARCILMTPIGSKFGAFAGGLSRAEKGWRGASNEAT